MAKHKEPDLDDNDLSTTKKVDEHMQPGDNDTPVKAKADKRSTRPIHDDDEDDYVPEKAWRNAGRYPPSWTLYEKMEKSEAGYRKGVPFHNCGKCNFYQSSHCKIVKGYISPDMGCVYFQEKYQAMVFTPMRVRIK